MAAVLLKQFVHSGSSVSQLREQYSEMDMQILISQL